jgi:hypothetical protein
MEFKSDFYDYWLEHVGTNVPLVVAKRLAEDISPTNKQRAMHVGVIWIYTISEDNYILVGGYARLSETKIQKIVRAISTLHLLPRRRGCIGRTHHLHRGQ